ncbi:hypothetical protein GJAV_G00243810 [Gymnothorax javanicus]|nr:hypothetical protein GJAV_G00243810 [Gymnothorax javanicus]
MAGIQLKASYSFFSGNLLLHLKVKHRLGCCIGLFLGSVGAGIDAAVQGPQLLQTERAGNGSLVEEEVNLIG